MLRLTGTLMITYVASFCATVLVGSAAGGEVGGPDTPRDRLVRATPHQEARPVATIEIVGANNPAVVLRAANGAVLYWSDPNTRTTIVARDADVPSVTLHWALDKPTRREPDSVDAERADDRVRCESNLGPILDPKARKAPGACLAAVDRARRQPS